MSTISLATVGPCPWKWAVAAVIVWILITPWNLAYRDQINAGYVETSDFATITGALTKSFEDAFIPGPVTGPIDQFFKHLKVRVPLLQEATLVMEYADTVGYLYGEKYLAGRGGPVATARQAGPDGVQGAGLPPQGPRALPAPSPAIARPIRGRRRDRGH